jgi:tRNA dimethylallyltransferase
MFESIYYRIKYLVAGPTAVGKSGLARELANRFPVEIVSVDSVQVRSCVSTPPTYVVCNFGSKAFKGLDIGSNKPTTQERLEIPHHFIDVYETTHQQSYVVQFIENVFD